MIAMAFRVASITVLGLGLLVSCGEAPRDALSLGGDSEAPGQTMPQRLRGPTVTLYQNIWDVDSGGPFPIQVVSVGGFVEDVAAYAGNWRGQGVSHIKIWLPRGQAVTFYSKKNYEGCQITFEGRGLREQDDISLDLEGLRSQCGPDQETIHWDDNVRSVRIH